MQMLADTTRTSDHLVKRHHERAEGRKPIESETLNELKSVVSETSLSDVRTKARRVYAILHAGANPRESPVFAPDFRQLASCARAVAIKDPAASQLASVFADAASRHSPWFRCLSESARSELVAISCHLIPFFIDACRIDGRVHRSCPDGSRDAEFNSALLASSWAWPPWEDGSRAATGDWPHSGPHRGPHSGLHSINMKSTTSALNTPSYPPVIQVVPSYQPSESARPLSLSHEASRETVSNFSRERVRVRQKRNRELALRHCASPLCVETPQTVPVNKTDVREPATKEQIIVDTKHITPSPSISTRRKASAVTISHAKLPSQLQPQTLPLLSPLWPYQSVPTLETPPEVELPQPPQPRPPSEEAPPKPLLTPSDLLTASTPMQASSFLPILPIPSYQTQCAAEVLHGPEQQPPQLFSIPEHAAAEYSCGALVDLTPATPEDGVRDVDEYLGMYFVRGDGT